MISAEVFAPSMHLSEPLLMRLPTQPPSSSWRFFALVSSLRFAIVSASVTPCSRSCSSTIRSTIVSQSASVARRQPAEATTHKVSGTSNPRRDRREAFMRVGTMSAPGPRGKLVFCTFLDECAGLATLEA